MKYPEYNQVELIHRYENGKRQRNQIIHPGEVIKYYGYTEMHISSARFKNILDYMADNLDEHGMPSVAGFTYTDNPVYYDDIIIDVDHDNPKDILALVNHLDKKFQISPQLLSIYFSGNKGFHIYIPSQLFGLEPSGRLNSVVRKIAMYLTDGIVDIDTQIYQKTSSIRLVNTINSASGLYKIPLYLDELTDISKIRALAKSQRELIYRPKVVETTQQLLELRDISVEYVKKNTNTIYVPTQNINSRAKLCILAMLKGVSKSDAFLGRKNVAFRLAVHFRNEGFDSDITYGLMSAWNKKNKPPLSNNIINSVIKSAYSKKYLHTCNDEVYKNYCNSKCFLYRGK